LRSPGIPIVRLRLELGEFAFKTTDTCIQQIEVSRMYRLINLTQNAPGPGQERFTCGMSLNMIHDTLPLFRLMLAFTLEAAFDRGLFSLKTF
jgi:hypothetical protein